jgi:hypothetical protein
MTYFADLSDYSYLGDRHFRPGTKNVGWLDLNHSFQTSEPTEKLLDAIWSFCTVSIAQTRGAHICQFCGDASANHADRNGETLFLGAAEIRVITDGGEIYAAPTLIYHYVKVHLYHPPQKFLEALFTAPSPPQSKYYDRLRHIGIEWSKTLVPDLHAAPCFEPFKRESTGSQNDRKPTKR